MKKKIKKPAAKKSVPARKSAKKRKSVAASSAAGTSASNRSSSGDLISLILEDHKALKKLIKVMKNSDLDLEARRNAFEEFVPLLITHAKPEEQVMYTFMKSNEELREEGFEGDVEHQLADQMAEEAERETDRDKFGAQIKVLAELVEHHIEEEEEDLLPDFRKETRADERMAMGNRFIDLKTKMMAEGSDDSPSEAQVERDEEDEELEEQSRTGAVPY